MAAAAPIALKEALSVRLRLASRGALLLEREGPRRRGGGALERGMMVGVLGRR